MPHLKLKNFKKSCQMPHQNPKKGLFFNKKKWIKILFFYYKIFDLWCVREQRRLLNIKILKISAALKTKKKFFLLIGKVTYKNDLRRRMIIVNVNTAKKFICLFCLTVVLPMWFLNCTLNRVKKIFRSLFQNIS